MLKQQLEAYVEVVKGEPLVLSIKAEGESPMSYRWFKGAQELKYCSGSVLRVKSASTLDNGQYCCTVSNNYGSVLSDVVLVKVILQRTALPPITQLGRLLLRQFSFSNSAVVQVFNFASFPYIHVYVYSYMKTCMRRGN